MKKLVLATVTTMLVSGALMSGTAFAQRYDRDDRRDDRYEAARGRFDEGDRIPYAYMQGGKYIYYDWRTAGLSRPSRGYAWMKIGDQYLLANQRTGEIDEVRPVRATRTRWVEGGRVPYEYMQGGKYIFYNWRSADLPRPPSGMAWMKIGDTLLLADQRSGRIDEVRPMRRW